MDTKNVDGSRLGTMSYLEIKNSMEATKTSEFKQYTRGNSACTKKIIMDIKVCGQLTSNCTYFDDICFSGVETDDETMAEVVELELY